MGYHRAGFEVTGVDIDPRYAKRYPFEFIAGDALEFVKAHGHEFDAIHASPPCQSYSISRHGNGHETKAPKLVEAVRDLLVATLRPYVIENVVGAPIAEPLMLCGTEFGLSAVDDDGEVLHLSRPRLFESNVFLWGAGGCNCAGRIIGGVYGGGSSNKIRARTVRHGGYTPSKSVREKLIGADWMTLHGLAQSIPPAYTEHIGAQLLAHVESERVA